MKPMRKALLFLLLALVLAQVAAARGVAFSVDGQVRDAAIDPERGIFLSIYDRNEVWLMDGGTGKRVAAIPVEQGPDSLVLSADLELLACLSRRAETLSLIDTQSLAVRAAVPCGKGACAVAALPGGGFAVANSFADSVTVVDPAVPSAPATIQGVHSVPAALAATAKAFVIGARVPPALHIYKSGAAEPTCVIPLSGKPEAIAVVEGERVAVATRDSLQIIDVQTQEVKAETATGALDVVANGGRVYALGLHEVLVWDTGLDTFKALQLDNSGRALTASDGALVVADPVLQTWQHFALREERVTMAASGSTASVGSGPALPVEDAPAAEGTIAAAEEDAAESERVDPSPRPEPPEDILPSRDMLQRVPLGSFEVRAPEAGWKPSPLPQEGRGETTITQALSESLSPVEEEGGFELPNLAQPLDLQARRVTPCDKETGYRLEDVRATLGETTLKTDAMTLLMDEDTGDIYAVYAEGDVEMHQRESALFADTLTYILPKELPERAVPPLVPEATEGERDMEQRIRLGRLEASNLRLDEPFRQFKADSVQYDFAAGTGEAINSYGHEGIYFFGAEKLRVLGPASADGEDVWVTTCDRDPPHYRVRLSRASILEGRPVFGEDARLQIGKVNTPIYWPRWAAYARTGRPIGIDFDSGHSAEIGYFVNFGQRFAVNGDTTVGFRFYPTSKEGVGIGLDGDYDYTQTPAAFLYGGEGAFHTLYTTEDRGYFEAYHRHEPTANTVLLLQNEQWFDKDFVKDFYYEEYRNRSEPRTFANLTYRQPAHILTATACATTNDFVSETERTPEVAFHVLERELAEGIYLSFDTVNGYNQREPAGTHAARSVNVARISLDLDVGEAFSVTPFLETEVSGYSRELEEDGANVRFSNTTGVTLQSRLHRSFGGGLGFSGFKHIVVPSLTYSYRPEPTMGVAQTPRFDVYDNVYGRSRIETKIDNILLGRDAKTKEAWQVARLTLYQGNDFWNETRKSEDYELELDLRPRPWWGWQMAAENHVINDPIDLDQPYFLERLWLELYANVTGKPYDPERVYRTNARYGDYERLLTYLYYRDPSQERGLNGRIGFSYTKTQGVVFNREVLYGIGCRVGKHWSLGFEHRYDFERHDLYRQTYEVRRDLHCWEAALQVQDRPSGWDVGLVLNIKAFPGSKIKF